MDVELYIVKSGVCRLDRNALGPSISLMLKNDWDSLLTILLWDYLTLKSVESLSLKSFWRIRISFEFLNLFLTLVIGPSVDKFCCYNMWVIESIDE